MRCILWEVIPDIAGFAFVLGFCNHGVTLCGKDTSASTQCWI